MTSETPRPTAPGGGDTAGPLSGAGTAASGPGEAVARPGWDAVTAAQARVDSAAGTAASPWASPATRTEVPAPALPPVRARAERGEVKPAWVVAVIATVVVLGALGTALAVQAGGGLRSLPTPTPAGEAGDTGSAAPVAPGYLAPGDLCEQADYTRMRPPFTTFGDLNRHQTATADLVVAECEGATGNSTVDGRFSFEIQVSQHPDALASLFDEQRASVAKQVPVTTIDGLGSRAYHYVAAGQTGLTVEVYDENLIMRLAWSADPGEPAPDGLVSALVETCRENLRLFRAT